MQRHTGNPLQHGKQRFQQLPTTLHVLRRAPLTSPTRILHPPASQPVASSGANARAFAPLPATRGPAALTPGLARRILAQPGIEGDPLAFLDVSEAYWRVLRNQPHEPHRKGPTIVKHSSERLFTPPGADEPKQHSGSAGDGAQGSSRAGYTDGNGNGNGNGSGVISSGSSNGSAGNGAGDTNGRVHAASAERQAAGGGPRTPHDFDVVIAGGTLGLFLATALQLRGWRVAIVEKRLVQGRNQEWNISWGELEVLVELGLLSREELRAAVVSEFNPIRVGFKGGKDMWTRDVLNLGVQPRRLLDSLRRRYLAAGGVIHENTAFKSATVHRDGLRLALAPGGRASPLAVGDTNRPNGLTPTAMPPTAASSSAAATPPPPRSLTCRLLLDCMGHYSDIVKQIRGRAKPDGMCMVVGSCAEGFPTGSNTSADLLYSLSHARGDMQLFWEAFPAEGGAARTTYMFAYSDAHPERPSFESLLDTYFELLPQYQGVPVDSLRFKRVLFGGFPCYSDGPLRPAFDRVMQIGDASAAQSPLSFGGFGSMMRHLGRLTRGLHQALSEDRLQRNDLAWLHPYQPSLSASWLFQRSMSIGVGQAAYPPGYPHAPGYAAAAPPGAASPPPAAEAAGEKAAAVPTAVAAGSGTGPAFHETSVAVAAGPLQVLAVGGAGSAVTHAPASPTHGPASHAPTHGSHSQAESSYASDLQAESAHAPLRTSHLQQQHQQQLEQQRQTEAEQRREQRGTKPESAAATATGSGARGRATFERDFRGGPSWLRLPYSHVNEILGCNFGVMGLLGDRVLRPFLQDTIQLVPLSLSMAGMMLANPVVVCRVLLQVGAPVLLRWFGHYAALLAYTLAFAVLRPLRGLVRGYAFQRLLDALEYGSGSDYRYHPPAPKVAPAAAAKVVEKAAAKAAAKPDGDGVVVTAPPVPAPVMAVAEVRRPPGPSRPGNGQVRAGG